MNTVFQQNTPSLKNIRTVIIICVIIVIGIIGAELYLINSQLSEMGRDAQTIDKIASQRTLSQKIVKNLYAYQNDSSLLLDIRKCALNWNDTHQSLAKEVEQNFNSPKQKQVIDSLFSMITPYQEMLYRTAVGNG
ncbi:MAG: hypothetical protein HUJ11_03350, partial [Arenibacter algicola]|nr:hypothetical protein [Arenibacter algicola]